MNGKKLPGGKLLLMLGIALSLLGIIVLLSPIAAGDMVVRLVAVVLVVAGVAQVLQALRPAAAGHKVASLILGAVIALVGLLVWFNSEIGSGLLTLLLMVFFATDGIWKIALALRARNVVAWSWLLLAGLVSIVFVYLLWAQWPLSGAWAIGVLVGLDLLLGGLALIRLGLALRRLRSSVYLDTINLG